MKLVIKYGSGEIRSINLHVDFFKINDDPSKVETLQTKANVLAYEFGPDPYHISVIRGNDVMYEKTIKQNLPPVSGNEKKIDETKIKKDLRKEFKNKPFTQKWVFTF